jgi:hypothetical protein
MPVRSDTVFKGVGGPFDPVDLDPRTRPGVPIQSRPQHPGEVGAERLVQQTSSVEVFRGRSDRRLTPVFGTTVPPRGLSGKLRAAAYRSPSWKARHWMLLMLADRVDALEHRGPSFPMSALAVGAVAAGLVRALKYQFN